MNKAHFHYLLFILLLSSCSSSRTISKTDQTVSSQFRVASYNIRYEAEADEKSGNGWNVRKGPLAELILKYGFELIGTQEGNDKQLVELKELIPDFDFIGHAYGGKTGTLHNCATFYNKRRFDVLDSGVFG